MLSPPPQLTPDVLALITNACRATLPPDACIHDVSRALEDVIRSTQQPPRDITADYVTRSLRIPLVPVPLDTLTLASVRLTGWPTVDTVRIMCTDWGGSTTYILYNQSLCTIHAQTTCQQ
jgi:hypothetical protein